MTIAKLGPADPAQAVLLLLERREIEARKRLAAMPDTADDVSLFGATAAWNEARTAFEAASAMLAGLGQSRQAA